jgi:hypothetical protein
MKAGLFPHAAVNVAKARSVRRPIAHGRILPVAEKGIMYPCLLPGEESCDVRN